MATSTSHAVTAVVPVKRLALAKSRLAVDPEQRRELALSFAVDTVAALAASPLVSGVLVVTSDRVVARRMVREAAWVVDEDGIGLGAAVTAGLRTAQRRWPSSGVAVVPADLPCLRPDVVTWVVSAASHWERAYVPDRSGTGTTIVVHAPGVAPVTDYGPGSAARHAALGLHALQHVPAGARHDVDSLGDLHDAIDLGAGAATTRAVDTLDLWPDGWAS